MGQQEEIRATIEYLDNTPTGNLSNLLGLCAVDHMNTKVAE